MPGANGEFVKLYLYLLRCAGTGRELSISSIADFFDHTEKDVRRALSYWEKLKLLKLRYDEDGGIRNQVRKAVHAVCNQRGAVEQQSKHQLDTRKKKVNRNANPRYFRNNFCCIR